MSGSQGRRSKTATKSRRKQTVAIGMIKPRKKSAKTPRKRKSS
jgi:hypothetical protein